ncbi:MAG TPA: TadE/TadG family type IV pilus assembly protein [Novosphingobium sp.]|nr:TadE/TadG family type IV pilus assembly protein [Novosphingobium sp.]
MRGTPKPSSLFRDDRGSTILEFAILGPILLALIMGVFAIGLQMQNYGALRAAASDFARYVVVEYQKDNRITSAQMENLARSMVTKSPYHLKADRLDVDVSEDDGPINGAKQFTVLMSYDPFNAVAFFGVGAPFLKYEQKIYVAD